MQGSVSEFGAGSATGDAKDKEMVAYRSPIARHSNYESGGRRFESFRARHG